MGDPQLRDYRIVGGLEIFADRSFWPNFFSRTVARLQWDPAAIDLSGDVRAWPGLRAARRRRLTTLLAGFCVAEDAVAEELTPFSGAARKATLTSTENLVAWVFFLAGEGWVLLFAALRASRRPAGAGGRGRRGLGRRGPRRHTRGKRAEGRPPAPRRGASHAPSLSRWIASPATAADLCSGRVCVRDHRDRGP